MALVLELVLMLVLGWLLGDGVEHKARLAQPAGIRPGSKSTLPPLSVAALARAPKFHLSSLNF